MTSVTTGPYASGAEPLNGRQRSKRQVRENPAAVKRLQSPTACPHRPAKPVPRYRGESEWSQRNTVLFSSDTPPCHTKGSAGAGVQQLWPVRTGGVRRRITTMDSATGEEVGNKSKTTREAWTTLNRKIRALHKPTNESSFDFTEADDLQFAVRAWSRSATSSDKRRGFSLNGPQTGTGSSFACRTGL